MFIYNDNYNPGYLKSNNVYTDNASQHKTSAMLITGNYDTVVMCICIYGQF